MQFLLSKLTRKHQATIPEPVRKYLSLKAGDSVLFEMEGSQVSINKAPTIDYAFTKALEGTLTEWSSPTDDEAYGSSQSIWA